MANQRPYSEASFVILLVSGILILVGSLGMGMLGWGGWMGGMGGMMQGYDIAWMTSMGWWMALVGLATGTLVLIAAVRLRQPNADATTWGATAIAAGAVSLLAMGGFLLGAIGAIIGGALALVRPPEQTVR